MVKVAVMGAGSWGTTLAKVFADAGNSVVLWVRKEAVARKIQISRENEKYLPGLILPRGIAATSDPLVALSDADIVVLAVPSQTLRENLARWKDDIPADATLVSLAKGIERDTHLRMTQVVAEVAQVDPSRIAVLSGPNLAREVALEQPAATVIACTDEERAKQVQAAVAAPYFRPYTNVDVIGCEIGGACKNVIALACGMATGKGLGENTLASLITRGLVEISRLGEALGADVRTFSGLAGWVTWWLRVRRRCRVTVVLVSGLVGVIPWIRLVTLPMDRWRREWCRRSRFLIWQLRRASICR